MNTISSTGAEPEDLAGGNSNLVERVGDKVRRPSGPWTPTIHKLLASLRNQGIDQVPEPFGVDSEGRELLSFIPGTVANYPLPDWLWSSSILEEASALLRRIHDATENLHFDSAIWQSPTHEPQEVICHNDFAPYNTVFDRAHLVGVIDFDTASPGPRIWDLAYLAYRLVPFGEHAGPGAPQVDAQLPRLELAIQAYGMDFRPAEVLEAMALRLEDLAEYTEGRDNSTGDAGFTAHAAMYRRDAARIRARAFEEL